MKPIKKLTKPNKEISNVTYMEHGDMETAQYFEEQSARDSIG